MMRTLYLEAPQEILQMALYDTARPPYLHNLSQKADSDSSMTACASSSFARFTFLSWTESGGRRGHMSYLHVGQIQRDRRAEKWFCSAGERES